MLNEWEFVIESESMISVIQNSSISTKEKKNYQATTTKNGSSFLNELNYSKEGKKHLCYH